MKKKTSLCSTKEKCHPWSMTNGVYFWYFDVDLLFLIDTDFCVVCELLMRTSSFIKFLGLIQRQVRELRRTDHGNYTATVMLIGIPNVGKSALANALHQVGRISAAGI